MVAARAAGTPDGDGVEPVVSYFLVPAGSGVEVVGEARLERGSEWTEQWLGLSANLYF